MGSGEQADPSEPRVWQDANAEVSTISPALRPRGGRSSPRGSPVFSSPSMVGTKYSSCGGLLAPTEVGAVHPHAMQDHRQAPTDGNDRLLHATPARDGHPPGLERRPFASPRHQNQGSLVHQRTQIAVTTSRDAPHSRDPSGLVYSRRQSDMGADASRLGEACRVVDDGAVGQGNDWTNARRRHQAPADRVAPCELEHHSVKRVVLRLKCHTC